ncbi:MAG: DinB family protein [Candidatus Dormibacteraeota bacterium]|nr:DinB family protein [Candidatus Dormibacteraeota bacterium]
MASWQPGENQWCVKECVGHMIETEGHGFAGRIRRILEKPGCRETGWDQAQVQRDRGDQGRPLQELLEAFSEMRADSLKLVEGLVNTDLAKTCVHEEVGELSIEDLLYEWVHHDRNHFRQVLGNIQAYVWPHMGSARRFVGR